MYVFDLQSYKAPTKDLFYQKETANPDRAKSSHPNTPPHIYVTMWKYFRNVHAKKDGVVAVTQ